jgi:hypothetical protein
MNKFVSSAATAISLSSLIALQTPAQAGTFPGLYGIMKDSLPCNSSYGECIMLRERVNFFLGWFGKTISAEEYCQRKYGNGTTVVWRFGMRWCAGPYQI